MTEVRKQMGEVQCIFVETTYRKFKFLHGDRWFRMHAKWTPFIQWFRGRRFVCLLTKEVPAKTTNSKSGSSFEILGVLSISNSFDEMSYINQRYWDTIKFYTNEADKRLKTIEFAEWLQAELTTIGRENDFYANTITSHLQKD